MDPGSPTSPGGPWGPIGPGMPCEGRRLVRMSIVEFTAVLCSSESFKFKQLILPRCLAAATTELPAG